MRRAGFACSTDRANNGLAPSHGWFVELRTYSYRLGPLDLPGPSSKSGSARDPHERAIFYVSYKQLFVIQLLHASRNSSQAG
jgi:hypothetical protein